MADRIVIDGASLTCAQVARAGRGQASVGVAPAAVAAARTAWPVAREVAGQRPVYGWTTGVGANRTVQVAAAEAAEHGLNLLRSHAAGAGPLLAADLARAMLVVRL
jgi:histidine ammonia-lyase